MKIGRINWIIPVLAFLMSGCTLLAGVLSESQNATDRSVEPVVPLILVLAAGGGSFAAAGEAGESDETGETGEQTGPCSGGATAVPGLADTGQTACYDSFGEIPCPGAGQAGYGQDAHYAGVPVARVYSCAAAAPATPADYTTTDEASGLIWQTCSGGQSGAGCAGVAASYSWAAAFAECSRLNTLNGGIGYGGRTDWRVPDIAELSSIIDYGRHSPAVDPVYFPGTVPFMFYWTANNYPSAPGYAFGIGFKYGIVAPNIQSGGSYLRCVAGP